MTKIIGITGGIGSGKSTLSEHLTRLGYPVHESDKAVSKMYKKPNKPLFSFIKKSGLGDSLKNKNINKKIIAEKIFNNDKLRNSLEKHIHKEVRKQRVSFIKKNKKYKKKEIFIDVPLLLENKLEKQFDLVLCIISTRKNRVKRVLKNKKFSRTTLNKIIKKQTTDKERRARSNIIIYNNKTKKDFLFRAQQALIDFLK